MQQLFNWTIHSRGLPWLFRYILTILLVLATFAVRVAYEEHLRAVPFLLFFLPIIVSALVFDRGSGYVAVAASAGLIAYHFLEPVGSFRVADRGQLNAFVLFVVVNTVLVTIIEALHMAYKELARRSAALAASEARFRAFVEGAPHKMWVTRADGGVEFFNAAWRDYTGLSPDPDQAAWAGIVHPDDRARLLAVREAGLAGGRAYDVEIRLRRRDGSYRWHVSSVSPLPRAEGEERPAWVGTSVDVHDAREAEAALRRERDRARLYFETAGVMLLVLGPDRRVIEINRAGAAILGRPAAEIVGRDWFEAFVPERHRERVAGAFARFVAEDADAPAEVENRVLRADGAERRIAWRNATLRDEEGRLVATVSSGLDVTDLRAAEEELRASEERGRLILAGARDHAILTTDRAGRITSWSPGAEAVFGYSAEEIEGGDVAVLFTPEDREAGVPEAERETARRDGHAPDRRWHLRRGGERFWVDGSTWPLHDSAGREIGFLKVGRDDTKRREAELIVREAAERQALLTREVGHRVKNNLAIIASLLSLQARSATQEETRRALGDARGRIDAIAQVHDHLWRRSHGEAVELDDFLRDLCERIQQAVPHHRVAYEGAGGPVVVDVDRAVALSLVVNELITNAVKYAYPGDEGGPVDVSLARVAGGRLRIVVADRGGGMPEDIAQGGVKEGSLGARMLRTYARQLDAELSIDSGPGGTRVTLVLPGEKEPA
jgi:PAS domain S-box-containing protein